MVRRSVRSGQSRSERVLTQRSCSLWVATVMIFSMRTPVVLGASLLLALPTASCSLLGDDGDPQAPADMLAAALSAKDLADVPFTGARPDEAFTAVVDGLGESGAKEIGRASCRARVCQHV